MRILKIDCRSGAAGDMFLGAFIALGMDRQYLIQEIQKLHLPVNMVFNEKVEGAIHGVRCRVLDATTGSDAEKSDHHAHRSYLEIVTLIRQSSLTESVKKISLAVFEKLAQAEMKVHGCPIEALHFHEAGALDSITDIVGTAVCFDWFRREKQVEKITVGPINTGSGFVRCAHGMLPVPPPAVEAMMLESRLSFFSEFIETEALTPTGLAILDTLAEPDTHQPYHPVAVGRGFGSRAFKIPNILTIVLAEIADHTNEVLQIETQIDDMIPEEAADFMEKLNRRSDIIDAYWTPIQMKKARPGLLLTLQIRPEDLETVSAFIFEHTSSIGIRYDRMNRIIMDRRIYSFDSEYGPVRIKVSQYQGIEKYKIEFDDLKRLSDQTGLPIRVLRERLQIQWFKEMEENNGFIK